MSKRAVVALLLVVAANSACGVLLSKGPPVGHEKMESFMCTDTDVYPVLDIAWALLNVTGALIIAADPDQYENANTAIVVGFAWGVGSTTAALVGFQRAKECRAAKHQLAQRQSGKPATAPLLQSVAVTPQNVTLEVGQTQQLVAAAYHSSGVAVPDRSFGWTSSNDSIASVSNFGLVTANGPGIATIAANTGKLVGTTRIVVVAGR